MNQRDSPRNESNDAQRDPMGMRIECQLISMNELQPAEKKENLKEDE